MTKVHKQCCFNIFSGFFVPVFCILWPKKHVCLYT